MILPDTMRDVSLQRERIFPVPGHSPRYWFTISGGERKEKVTGIFKAAYDAKYEALSVNHSGCSMSR